MLRVDLNADLGEGYGVYAYGDDAGMMASVSSVNVACGVHGGDPGIIRRTLRHAGELRLAIGAHPSLPDRQGFGRREMRLPPGELEDLVIYQIGAVAALARAEGLRLRHVKPHGALYHMAAQDDEVARAVAAAVRAVDPGLVLYGLSGSRLIAVARDAGLATAAEAFADRAYEADGRLTGRDRPGALLTDPASVVQRGWMLVSEGHVAARDGTRVPVTADTICLHGDTPGAASLARAVRELLELRGVRIAPPPSAVTDL